MLGDEARTVSHLRRLVSAQEEDSLLLTRFLTDTDAGAFAELVRRHGPMVLGVCRRVLGNGPDADDAFQAAFIVLARKGHSVRSGRSVASFLFGVARFAALRARDKDRRRREYEARAATEPRSTHASDPELLAVLDEELQRLPDHLRAPLVACFLQSHTQEEAAKELGCSLSTLRRRLERGQELLRERLTGRGAVPALAVLAAGVDGSHISATVVESTTALVVAVFTGTAGTVPATALAKGVISAMAQPKFKTLVAVLVAAGLAAGGFAWQLAGAQPPKPVVPDVPPADAKAAPKPTDRPTPPVKPDPKKAPQGAGEKIKPGDWLVIRVKNAFVNDPIDGPFEVEPTGKVLLGPVYGRVKVDGLTVEDAEPVILKFLKQYLRNPVVSVARGQRPESPQLEQRVQQLEKEVRELRAIVEELRNKKP
jgi:RNA polymerase sigma factor (sigma-70 family)